MSLIKKILAFFGFGANVEKPTSFEQLLEKYSSIARQNEARQTAFRAVQNGDDISPDRSHPYEAEIRSDALIVDTACTQYHTEILTKSFGDAQYLTVLLQAGLQNQLAQATPEEIEARIRARIVEKEAEAQLVVDEYKKAEHDLAVFKGANGLSSAANYPDKKDTLYFIAFLGLVEAVFNAIFLRNGLSGRTALVIALTIAAINIAGNVWFGSRYRDKNHIKPEISGPGKLNKIYAVGLILFLNILVAGYRLLFMSNTTEGLTLQFIFESVILFIVGIALGMLAFNKGYALDDPYPEYGHYSRRLAEWVEKLTELKTQHAKFCSELKSRADRVLDDLETKILSTSETFTLQLPEMSRRLKVWDEDRNRINFAYRQIQEIFKLTIKNYHPRGHLGYPNELLDMSENVQLTSYKETVAHYLDGQDDLRIQVKKLREEVRQQKLLLQNWWQNESTKNLLSFPK